jgi:deoxyribonuclease V
MQVSMGYQDHMETPQNCTANDLEVFARTVQNRMKERYGCGRNPLDPVRIRTIGGADAAYRGDYGIGVVVLLSYPSLELVTYGYALRHVLFPYIPGLFAFRELPLIMAAFEKMGKSPDLLILDGHGYAHPCRFGYACHAGAALGIPTIGIAKRPMTRLVKEPGDEPGMHEEIVMEGEVTGIALSTKSGARPVYVSAGYRTSLQFAMRMALETTRHSRICEPLRVADQIARKCRAFFLQASGQCTKKP